MLSHCLRVLDAKIHVSWYTQKKKINRKCLKWGNEIFALHETSRAPLPQLVINKAEAFNFGHSAQYQEETKIISKETNLKETRAVVQVVMPRKKQLKPKRNTENFSTHAHFAFRRSSACEYYIGIERNL